MLVYRITMMFALPVLSVTSLHRKAKGCGG